MSSFPPPPGFLPFTLPLEGDEEELEKLKRKIERERGFNCKFYKDKCLRRRIAVRMRARGQRTFAEYAGLLDREPQEYDQLLDTLTINVTKFFRNLETWEAVERQVVPALFARPGPIRVWSAGAASGEEAYTVSILLREWAERNGKTAELDRRLQITGTDIDRRSLDTARAGVYPDLSVAETPERVLRRWFSDGPPYRIAAEAKKNVGFARRDLISGEPEREQTLIVCRNVVIYFDREIQERLFKVFHDALVPGGWLLLGKVETLIGAARTLFRSVNNRERIFQRPA
jgi:chemotaxis methyl-accepting protein methylase